MKARQLFLGILAVATLGVIGWQFGIHVRLGYSALNYFSYFTNLSNLLAAVVLLFGAIGALTVPRRKYVGARLRYISTVNMIIVGIVFVLLLRNEDLGDMRPWNNALLHYVMPCVLLLDWLLEPPDRRLDARDFQWCFAFPLLYLLYVLLRGHRSGWYLYPFLDPARVGGYEIVALYCLGILFALFLVAGALLLIANRAPANIGQART